MVWEPKTCCCGSAKTGTLILGWLGSVGSVIWVVIFVSIAGLSDSIIKLCNTVFTEILPDVERKNNLMPNSISGERYAETCREAYIGFISIFGILSVYFVIMNILLLVGVEKTKPKFMLPFLITHLLGVIVEVILAATAAIAAIVYGDIRGFFLVLLLQGAATFLHVYFLLVVRVCYKEVKQHSLALSDDINIDYVKHKDYPADC